MMYDELIKRLRTAKAVVFKAEDMTLLGDAADAIEGLSAKYEKALQDLVKQAEPPKEEI